MIFIGSWLITSNTSGYLRLHKISDEKYLIFKLVRNNSNQIINKLSINYVFFLLLCIISLHYLFGSYFVVFYENIN